MNTPEYDAPNPYASHGIDSSSQSMDAGTIPPGGSGWITQVLVVGILQIVLGVSELIMAFMLVAGMIFMRYAITQQAAQGLNPAQQAQQAQMLGWLGVYYCVAGGFIFVSALLRIASGIASFWFKLRIFFIVSLVFGLISVSGCYCAPFSIGLCIYGLIVLLNPYVKYAYQLAAQGVLPADIKSRFTSGSIAIK